MAIFEHSGLPFSGRAKAVGFFPVYLSYKLALNKRWSVNLDSRAKPNQWLED